MEVTPLLHFGNYAKVTAIDVHPHDRVCAVATNNGCIYTLPLANLEEEIQHGELNLKSQRVSLVVTLSLPATQLAWARWRSGKILGALIGSKMARLLSLGSDGQWKEVEFLDVPDCNYLAFSPLKHELACACTGGRLVVLKRTGDVWATKWSDGPESIKGTTHRKDAMCVAWSDNGMLSMGDNEGFVRVFNVQRGPREILCEQLVGTVQHVAFAPTLARSFTLMATATQDMIVIYALSVPNIDEKDAASQNKLVDLDHSFAVTHNRKRTTDAQRYGKESDKSIVVGCVSLNLGNEMASRLRWNSMGNTLCCSLVDGALRMYRLHCRYRTRQHEGRGEPTQTLEMDLEEIGNALPPFHYDRTIEL